MNFLIDAQLPPDLVLELSRRGHDAVHVSDIGMIAAPDTEIWERALEEGRILLTKDRDFAEWAAVRRPAPRVVWIRTGNLSRAAQTEHLRRNWLRVETRLSEGARVVEVR